MQISSHIIANRLPSLYGGVLNPLLWFHGKAEHIMLEKMVNQAVRASKYSYDGCHYLLRSEFAARLEVYAYFWMMVILILLKTSWTKLGIMTILFLMMIAFEALNTAIEVIIDRVSPEISPAGKRAKDLGSFAVFCMIVVNGIFFFGVIFTSAPVTSLIDYIMSRVG